MIPDPVDIIYCEVCELPHRRGVAVCEECRHFLGTAPNWERLRFECPLGVKRWRAVVVPLRERGRWPKARTDWPD